MEALQRIFPTLLFSDLYKNRNTPIPITLGAELVGVRYNSLLSYAKRRHLYRPTYKKHTCITLGDLAVYAVRHNEREESGVNQSYRKNIYRANRQRLNKKESEQANQ